MANGTQGLANGVGTGGAGCDRRHGTALAVVANGNAAGCHIGNHHRYAQRGHPMRASAFQLSNFRRNGIQSANAGTKVDAHPLRGQCADDAGFFHRLHCRTHGVLDKFVRTQHFAAVHIVHGIKVLDLGTQLGFVVGCIKIGNGANAVIAGNQVLPGSCCAAANGTDDAKTGDHHSSCFTHVVLLTWQCRRQPAALRRLHTLL